MSVDPYLIQKMAGKEPLGGSKLWTTVSLIILIISLIALVVFLILQLWLYAIGAAFIAAFTLMKYLIFKKKPKI